MKKYLFIFIGLLCLILVSCQYHEANEFGKINQTKKESHIIKSETMPNWQGPEDIRYTEEVESKLSKAIHDAGVPEQNWLSTSGASPRLYKSFRSSENIRWYWAGCMTLLGVNSSTKELLLVDGYISKAADGLNSFIMLPHHVKRIERYAKGSSYKHREAKLYGIIKKRFPK